MAISYVGQAVASSSPNADATITLPTGSMVANDLILIAASVADNTDNALGAPLEGGYTDVVGSTLYANDVNDVNLNVFYKYWNGTDTTATFDAVGGTNASNVAVCMVFRGVRLAADGGPFTTTPTTNTGVSSSNADPPSIATASGDAVVIVGATGHTGGATATYTNPTNYTTNPAVRAHNDTFDGLVGMGYRLSGYSNPENPGVFTAANIGTAADNAWAAVTMALKEAAAAAHSLPGGAEAGSYTITGVVAGLDVELNAAVGSYDITGTAATLIHGWPMSADSGSYTLYGETLDLRGNHLFADVGDYAIVGATAILAFGIEAVGGVYGITGTDADLIHAVPGETLAVDPGSYALSGTDATLKAGRLLDATTDSYALSGTDADLLADLIFGVDPGDYVLDGQAVTLIDSGAAGDEIHLLASMGLGR